MPSAPKTAAKPAAKPAAAAAPKAAAAAKPAAAKTAKASSSVPESVLKKQKTLEKIKAAKAKAAPIRRKARLAKRKLVFKRAEQYAHEYRSKELNLIRLRRIAKKHGNYFAEPDAKIYFVVRIRGINAVDPKTRKILQLLRLRGINNGVFIKVNSASLKMLRIVAPYVTYGEPNLKSIKELIYKRGFGKIDGQRIPISENSVIEKALGKYGIICIEDLVHEIITVGKHFREANNFLWPFKLNSPNGGLSKKRISFVEGGQFGDREEYINRLIRRML